MTGASSLKIDALAYLIGTGFYAATQWLLVILYANTAGPAGVGLFALATAISAPIVVLSQMSLRQVMIADVGARFPFREYLTARLVLSAAAMVAIAILAVAMGYRGASLLTVLAFGLGRVFESISDIFYARRQSQGGLTTVSIYTAVRGALTLAAAAGVMLVTGDILASSIAWAGASGLCQLMVQVLERKRVGGAGVEMGSARVSRELFAHAAPLAVSQFLVALTAYSPRLVLEHLGGEKLVGQASAIEYILAFGTLGVAALGQAASSAMAIAYYERDQVRLTRLVTAITTGSTIIGVGMAAVALIVGKPLVLAVYGAEFDQAAQAMAAIIGGGTFVYVASVLGYAVSATGRYKNLIGWSVIVLIVTLVASYVSVSRYGLPGLGYALAWSGSASILGYAYLLGRAMRAQGMRPSFNHSRGQIAHD